MGRIGVYVERYTITHSEEMGALMKFGQVARKLGHHIDYLFRPDIYKIPQYDAVFIRALTDPLNTSYIASRTAELNNIRVLDDSKSIYICCDKVNMYRHMQSHGVPLPETLFLKESDLTIRKGAELLDHLGEPLVLKAPNSSFSLYVEKAHTPQEFVKIGNKFLRRSDRIVVQKFIRSEFDWRVGMLGGQILYVCQYTIPKKRWKILTYIENGKAVYGPVRGVDVDKADPKLLEIALAAGAAVGNGLYGVDLKQVGDSYVVIEVNDNPSIDSGAEDQNSPQLYERIIRYLLGEWG